MRGSDARSGELFSYVEAYILRESFDQLWDYKSEAWARRFFDNWKGASPRRSPPATRQQISLSLGSRSVCPLHGPSRRDAKHEPVSARSRTGLRVSKTEIEKARAETGAQICRFVTKFAPICASRDWVMGPNPAELSRVLTPGYDPTETGLAGWAERIRTALCRVRTGL
jgi:hypothetical protein